MKTDSACRDRLLFRRRAGLFLPIGVLFGVAFGGCAKVCDDDGFAWQQDKSCLGQLSATETDSSNTESDSDTEPTGSATDGPTTTGGGAGKWCVDADGDGAGDPDMCTDVPPGDTPPDGTVNNDGDCDDGDPNTFPGAAEYDSPVACMTDADGDGWGDVDPPGDGGPGEPVPGSDCDDASANTFPGAAPKDDPDACMKDEDGDDYGDKDPPGQGGEGGVVPGSDCNDADANAFDKCGACTDADGDGAKVDCDSYPPGTFPDCDDSDPNTFPGAAPEDDPDACMTDADGDDWGDSMPKSPDAVPGTDCDDSDPMTYPGAAAKDSPTDCMHDGDGDGHGDAKPDPEKPGVIAGSDCYDDNPMFSPSNNVLLTSEISTGSMLEVDLATGTLTEYGSVDVQAFNPWIPTSVAVNPVDGTIVAALAFRDKLVTMNYCGAGVPTAFPAAHKKKICGISYDRDGVLYGVDGQVDQFLTFNPDGSLSPDKVKPLSFEGKTLNVADCGMAFDCHMDRVLISDSGSGGIYVVDTTDGTTTRVADLAGEAFGSGLEYDPTTKQALSCDDVSLLSIALDGSNNFTQLPDLAAPADDLGFGPKCN
jgi:hypothetical protein